MLDIAYSFLWLLNHNYTASLLREPSRVAAWLRLLYSWLPRAGRELHAINQLQ